MTCSNSNPFAFTSGATHNIYNNGTGIGIDDAGPAYKFEVNGTVGASNYYIRSDRKLKKNIQNISESSLERLFDVSDKLFKKFTFKSSGKDSYGFIAQQLEQYIPEAVNNAKEKGIKSVDYSIAHSKLLAAAINEIKKLKKEVQELRKLVN